MQQNIEDLRAANEELMSVNEEFQSSNEELETSKEELQSLNEEITTANTQLESKLGELEATNNDLDNLLTSTNIATLFLDTQLRIRRFTPVATRLFSLIPSDIGRPIGDIAQKFTDPSLLTDAGAVLHHPNAPKTEMQGHDGRWYVRQVLPYCTRDDRTEGVVITFSDVAAEALHEARLYAESIVDTVREPLLVLDADLRVRSANQSFSATFHVSQEDTVGQLLGSGKTASKKLLALLDDASGEALRAGSIVEHLRHFIEKGQPQFERTDLREIARNIPRLLGREIEREHVTLQVDLPPRPLPVYVDQIQIEQIMVNLMQNATDTIREAAIDRAEIQLQVWAAKGMAEVAVRDTGAGVSDAAAERMFEPFFPTKAHGLGMGLAISRSIIEAHRGRIWVKRRADGARGTTIRFTLPLLQPSRPARKGRRA